MCDNIVTQLYGPNKSVPDADSRKVYEQVKQRLLVLVESDTERMLRLRTEWATFEKTKGMTAHQFEAKWTKLLAEQAEVNLLPNKQELHMQYLMKIPPHVAEKIRFDRRPRPNLEDPLGPYVTRPCDNWEECHAVAVEMEAIQASTKAYQVARAGGIGNTWQPYDNQAAGLRGKGAKGDKGKKGDGKKGKGKEGKGGKGKNKGKDG